MTRHWQSFSAEGVEEKRIIVGRQCCCYLLTVATCSHPGHPSNLPLSGPRQDAEVWKRVTFLSFFPVRIPYCHPDPIAEPRGHGILLIDAWTIELLIYSSKSFIDPSADITLQYMHTRRATWVYPRRLTFGYINSPVGKEIRLRHAIVG